MVPPVMNDKIMNLSKGWIAYMKTGEVIVEGDIPWNKVVKRNIQSLSLKWHDKYWTVHNKESYICFNRKCASLSQQGSYVELVARCIGYYDTDGSKVIYQVDENTGKMELTVREG